MPVCACVLGSGVAEVLVLNRTVVSTDLLNA